MMNRRAALYASAAVAAAISGAGVAWWKASRGEAKVQSGISATDSAGQDAFWNLAFETPDGKVLAMNSFRGKALLVNFWATWCPPCIEELPLIDSFYSLHKSRLQVLGLAVDQPSAVRKWLAAKPLAFPVGMAGLNGTQLSRELGNQAGSLPFSVFFRQDGVLQQKKTGKLAEEDLSAWTQKL
jgi:thiol-disulfide isomerase/thioredoxin